jgi:hypothetical protein
LHYFSANHALLPGWSGIVIFLPLLLGSQACTNKSGWLKDFFNALFTRFHCLIAQITNYILITKDSSSGEIWWTPLSQVVKLNIADIMDVLMQCNLECSIT